MNLFQDFLDQLQADRARLDTMAWDWQEPPEEPGFGSNRIQWLDRPTLKPLQEPISLDKLRKVFPIKMHEYLAGPSEKVLLIKAPPGTGKTHAMVGVLQYLAKQGYRTMWAASRHNMFGDLSAFEHFTAPMWYHWQGIGRKVKDEPVCRYADYQSKWLRLGYRSLDLCRRVCQRDGWIGVCPYRQQAQRKEPIIFCQHQHLVYGLSLSGFDFAIVDELPLGAFANFRKVPTSGLDVGASGYVGELIDMVKMACEGCEERRRVSGRQLWDKIGPSFERALEQIDADYAVPEPPQIYNVGQVEAAPWWYVYDLLLIGQNDHRAWAEGWKSWTERVWVTRGGLHLASKKEPWQKLPLKITVLDATGQPELYRLIFNREVETYNPYVERVGKVYQIAHRLNGKWSTWQNQELTKAGKEMLEIAKRLTAGYQNPGVICWKAIAPTMQEHFPNVFWFGNLRGSNGMDKCDILIVMGAPSPNQYQMLDLAAALTTDMGPLFTTDDEGKRNPIYTRQEREYRLLDGRGAARRVGVYVNRVLDIIHEQNREAEIVQALHRARVNLRDVEVWLLTATPTDEPLDGLWDDPPLGPEGIDWRVWLRLQPWLEEQDRTGGEITNTTVGEAMGVDPTWVSKAGWLNILVEKCGYVIKEIEKPTRGRKPKILVKNTDTEREIEVPYMDTTNK